MGDLWIGKVDDTSTQLIEGEVDVEWRPDLGQSGGNQENVREQDLMEIGLS